MFSFFEGHSIKGTVTSKHYGGELEKPTLYARYRLRIPKQKNSEILSMAIV